MPRKRQTRADLKRNMYQHGFSAGVRHERVVSDRMKERYDKEVSWVKSLLRIRSAASIHEAIKDRHAS